MIAHDTGRLDPGTWLCSCRACITLAANAPEDVLVVLKCETKPRMVIPAYALADAPADVIAGDYVREVWVAL